MDLDTLKVETDIPLHADFGDTSLMGKQEMWVPLIEKAYAQYLATGLDDPLAGYDFLNQGGHTENALEQLTGKPSTVYKSTGALPMSGVSLEDLKEMQDAGKPITLSSQDAKPKTGSELPMYASDSLVYGHAYYITDIDVANDKITIQNPWGWEEGGITMTYQEYLTNFDKLVVGGSTTK
jgi:hypothetical protein